MSSCRATNANAKLVRAHALLARWERTGAAQQEKIAALERKARLFTDGITVTP